VLPARVRPVWPIPRLAAVCGGSADAVSRVGGIGMERTLPEPEPAESVGESSPPPFVGGSGAGGPWFRRCWILLMYVGASNGVSRSCSDGASDGASEAVLGKREIGRGVPETGE
jgi:hypothetical protein